MKDSLVVMRDKNQCRVFHDGATVTAPPYWPALWNTFAYLDANGSLGLWHKGSTSAVMQREPVKTILLDRGLITLTNNATKVWWKGSLYEP